MVKCFIVHIKRGKIVNRARAQQIKDFVGLRWGNITPTDIDCFVDFQNRLFVIIEYKCGEAQMPRGQELALERLCDACEKAEIPTYLLAATHNHKVEEDIDCAQATVTNHYHKREWKECKEISVKEAIDKLRKKYLDNS